MIGSASVDWRAIGEARKTYSRAPQTTQFHFLPVLSTVVVLYDLVQI